MAAQSSLNMSERKSICLSKIRIKAHYVGRCMIVRKCKIVVRFTYRNHRDEENDYTEEFVSFPDFGNYWRWQPERAKVLNGETVENARTLNVRLSLFFQDEEHTDEIGFNNVTELTNYLKKNPPMTKVIQYA